MKIVCTDNFDRDHISDKLIAENMNNYYGELIVKLLNKNEVDPYAPDFYKLVPDDYELYEWKP